MNNGKLKFSRVGEDEVIGECPFTTGYGQLCRVRLAKAGNKSFEGEPLAMGLYTMFFAAEINHLDDIRLPEPKKITPEDVFELTLTYDVITEGTIFDKDEESEDGEATDENPTDTQAVSS